MSSLWDVLTAKWIVPKNTHPSFAGRNIIVTGANVGLGYEAALKFVQLGANKVILGVRTISKGENAKKAIEAKTGLKGVVEVWQLDMLDYTSVKAFADQATKELDHLDVVCLNAGVASFPYRKSQYGYEETMQVNVLSTTLLALLLIPKLRASKTTSYTPVLEIVGSANHYMVTKLHSESAPFATYNTPESYRIAGQYSVSKLFIMYVEAGITQLANNKGTEKPDFYVDVVCPGPTQSDLARDASAWYWQIPLFLFRHLVQRKTEQGARTYISGVAEAEKAHGGFWKDDRVREPAPLMIGEKGKQLQQTVWREVLDALEKSVPEVKQLAKV